MGNILAKNQENIVHITRRSITETVVRNAMVHTDTHAKNKMVDVETITLLR